MWPIIFTLITIAALAFAIRKIRLEKKRTANRDPKSWVTASCCLLIGFLNITAYWFGFLGVVSMTGTVALLLTAAYFARYMQNSYIEGN